METISAITLVQNFSNYREKNQRIVLENKTILGDLLILNREYDFHIRFSNCIIESFFIQNVIWYKDIEFDNCTFKKTFDIRGLRSRVIKFDNCHFEKDINVVYCYSDYFMCIKTECLNGINFSSGIIKIFTVNPVNEKTNFTFIGKFLLIDILEIKSVSGITIFSKNCIINSINLTGYYNISSRLDFNNILNTNLEISELNNDGKIYFSNIKQVAVEKFHEKPVSDFIDKFINSDEYEYRDDEADYIRSLNSDRSILDMIAVEYSLIDFTDFIEKNFIEFYLYKDIKPAKLAIKNSSLGVFEIKNLNFDWKYEIDIQNSDLSSIKLINSKIPDLHYTDDYLNYYNVYNDLYSSASKQNNTKDKIEYYRISQRYLYNYLKKEAPFKSRDAGSRIAILISGYFSNHGTNWIKAVIITILFTLFLFIWFVLSLKETYISLTWKGFTDLTKIILTYAPQFINPLHKIDFMNNFASLGTWSGLIDLFARIVIGIGIFEIIRSFRKHVRQ